MTADYMAGFSGPNRELHLDSLEIHGRVPAWLSGTLIRNGPGTFQVGSQPLRHWFDGPAMLHRFGFAGGRVTYAGKYLDTDAYTTAKQAGGLTYSEFATDPCRSLFKRVMTLFSRRPTDSAKVSIGRFGDRFLALAETPIQVEFDPDTLRSVGVFAHESNPVGQMTTPHPHFADEAMFNVVTRYNRVSQYRLYRTSADAAPERIGAIPVQRPSYMHSFGLSPRYAIITDQPFTVNPIMLLLWLKPFIENFHWQTDRPTRFFILDRQTGETIARCESDPFFAFHHVNAFEAHGEIVVDVVGYDNADIITSYYLNRLSDPGLRLPKGTLRRYRIRPERRRVYSETLSDTLIEMPHFDYARHNMDGAYRWVYGIGLADDNPTGFYNQIVRIDVQTGNTLTWREAGCYPGEPIFVRAPAAEAPREAEDAGVILSVVLDAAAGRSFLLILDAATLGEIARAVIPQPVLFGYHGAFVER